MRYDDGMSSKGSKGDKKSKRSNQGSKYFVPIKDLFDKYLPKEGKGYITREFQDYGYRLALELDDLKHKSLYIKLARDVERWILEKARSFVNDAAGAKSKPKLFMWKVGELKKEAGKKS